MLKIQASMTARTQAITALTRLLEAGDEADRCYAARALGVFGDESAVDALIARLQDKDIDVCVDAAEALRKIGDPKAIPSLIQSLENDSSGEVCTVVAAALGRLGGKKANDALLKIAATRPERLDWDDDWDSWWDVQLEAIKALGQAKEERAIETLLDILDNPEQQDIESDVLMALAQMEGKGIDTLIQRLKEGSPRSRRRAIKALGSARSAKVYQALGQVLKDDEAEVRTAAINALAEQHATNYLPAILLLMRDENETVRSAAIPCACKLASSTVSADKLQEHLLLLLNDPSGQVRSCGFDALAKTAQKEALPPEAIAAANHNLNDSSPHVASSACALLGKRGDASVIPSLTNLLNNNKKHPVLRREAALALGEISLLNDELIQALTQAINDQEQSIRLAALMALMQLAACSRTDQKEEPLDKQPLEVVIAALEGKIHIASPENELDNAETVESNEALMDNKVEEATEPAALSTLDAIAMDNVEAALGLNNEESESNKIDDEATHYLAVAERQKKEAERMLVKHTFDVATDVRQLAAKVLANSEKEEVIIALARIMRNESDEKVATEAIISLGEIARKTPKLPSLMDTLGPLIAQLSIGERDRRLACARTLGRLKNRAAMAPLLTALADEIKDVRIEAIHSLTDLIIDGSNPVKEDHMVLEEVANTTVVQQFLDRLEDPANGVRLATAQGLARLVKLEELQGFTEEVVDKMLAAATLDGGQQSRPMGQSIRATSIELGAEKLLAQLDEASDSTDRRFIIEMLEELFKPEPNQKAA